MKTTFQVYKAADGWRWRLVASNGRIVADSGEAYTRRAGVIRAVGSLDDLVGRAYAAIEFLDSAPPVKRTKPPPPSAAADKKAREKRYG